MGLKVNGVNGAIFLGMDDLHLPTTSSNLPDQRQGQAKVSACPIPWQ